VPSDGWASSGKELYYLAPDATLIATSLTIKNPLSNLEVLTHLFRTRIVGGGTDHEHGNFSLTCRANGRFLINTAAGGRWRFADHFAAELESRT
jgi:hypothetical protein